MQTGTTVIHPRLGKGTVVFDKPHCIQIRFIEHGLVNFTQERWMAQMDKAPKGIPDVEYALVDLVDQGLITEAQGFSILGGAKTNEPK